MMNAICFRRQLLRFSCCVDSKALHMAYGMHLARVLLSP
jgi:hypothetical protein